ncbi:hypothetical protein [Sphingomonas sp. PAMC 26621]|uniref:hypothetical protein n=1 Tax=Sphingomonas sp. PAMC 26621 TaxID=1112213 RepID=UPI000288F3C3|nr:hypothetical protein [Sphingomonas sp. PAMC 26621]
MIVSSDLSRLVPSEKAALIYAQAHGDVTTRLWRAALGSSDTADDQHGAAQRAENAEFNLDSLLALFTPKGDAATAAGTPIPIQAAGRLPAASPVSALTSVAGSVTSLLTGLGANARFGQAFVAAAARTGVPAAALAAIVDAEAAKTGDGGWKTTSRNPRSSAAGLGQFLGGTWQSEAERAGTWLHATAVTNGWLGDDGRVHPNARSALLALRYDATASINATADYASRSVAQLKRAGVAVGEDLTTIARAAYLGHHLGTADAVRFLTGSLDSGRARRLLDAQVGRAAASHRITQARSAASAHRSWLLDFVSRHVMPARFSDAVKAIATQIEPLQTING